MRTFTGIYVSRFNKFRFLAEVSTKLQKLHFFDNLRTIAQEGNMETRQTPNFMHLLFPLELFVTFIFVFKNSHN